MIGSSFAFCQSLGMWMFAFGVSMVFPTDTAHPGVL